MIKMSNTSEEYAAVQKVVEQREKILIAMEIIKLTLISIFSLLVLIRIRCTHKRNDFFFTLVPTLMILA